MHHKGQYYQTGKRSWIRLHEKGGKHHEVPTHHTAEEYLNAYIKTAAIQGCKDSRAYKPLLSPKQWKA
jgi:hypothetical protein